VHFIIAIITVFGILAVTHEDPIRSQIQIHSIASSSAPAAGHLQPGDLLLKIDGRTIASDGSTVTQVVSTSIGKPVSLLIERHGQRLTETLTPRATQVAGKTIGRIGVTEDQIAARVSTAAAFPRTFGVLGEFLKETGSAIKGLPGEVGDILKGSKTRNPNGAASVVDIARVSGQVASTSDATVGARFTTLLLIVAELNLFVGIFNLLPLLPLDGGHIAILGFEQARSRVYRLIGRRDPGRVDIMKVLPVTYAVVALFVGLSLILIYAGITNPIKLQ
jgi:membrane-associated protease RseP (regulator of RpoE activity)